MGGDIFGGGYLVEQKPCTCCHMWPWVVLCDGSRCGEINFVVKYGHMTKTL